MTTKIVLEYDGTSEKTEIIKTILQFHEQENRFEVDFILKIDKDTINTIKLNDFDIILHYLKNKLIRLSLFIEINANPSAKYATVVNNMILQQLPQFAYLRYLKIVLLKQWCEINFRLIANIAQLHTIDLTEIFHNKQIPNQSVISSLEEVFNYLECLQNTSKLQNILLPTIVIDSSRTSYNYRMVARICAILKSTLNTLTELTSIEPLPVCHNNTEFTEMLSTIAQDILKKRGGNLEAVYDNFQQINAVLQELLSDNTESNQWRDKLINKTKIRIAIIKEIDTDCFYNIINQLTANNIVALYKISRDIKENHNPMLLLSCIQALKAQQEHNIIMFLLEELVTKVIAQEVKEIDFFEHDISELIINNPDQDPVPQEQTVRTLLKIYKNFDLFNNPNSAKQDLLNILIHVLQEYIYHNGLLNYSLTEQSTIQEILNNNISDIELIMLNFNNLKLYDQTSKQKELLHQEQLSRYEIEIAELTEKFNLALRPRF